MKRRLHNLAMVFSVMLGIATAALWVRSYRTYDAVVRGWRSVHADHVAQGAWQINSYRGIFQVAHRQDRLTHSFLRDELGISASVLGDPGTYFEYHKATLAVPVAGQASPYPPFGLGSSREEISSFAGFAHCRVSPVANAADWTDGWFVAVPMWFVLVMCAVLPARKTWHLLRDRWRIPEGHCRHCGYNLTGNVSGVCPECGTAVRVVEGAGRG